jgi:ABC-type lipoprotein release transport system permease subunit
MLQPYGVTSMDAVAFLTAPALVVLMTLAAAGLPASRTARIDPLVALRSE